MRATYLLQSQLAELEAWGLRVRTMFLYEMPYLVGSALTSPNWRDVDVRVLLPDRTYDDLATLLVPSQLNLAMSVWGQKVTDLPIDFQIQRRKEANDKFKGRRHPIGIKRPDPELPSGCGECGGRLWQSVCADCGMQHGEKVVA